MSSNDLPKRDASKAAERMAERRARDAQSGFEVGNDNQAERGVGEPSPDGWNPTREH